jgi:ribosomal protein L37AE/L43A
VDKRIIGRLRIQKGCPHLIKNRVNDMRCPNCNSKDIGKIGSHQFYCWGCFIELAVNGEKMSVYQVEEDGTLSSLDDLFFEEEISQVHAN